MDEFHPFDSRCDVSFKLLVCSGHHVSLRLLSLHLCNECPSPQKKAKLKKNGRFVAAQGNLCGCQITLASVYAPVERQERAPFFQQQPHASPASRHPPSFGGDWNCVARDQGLVGGQPATRQSGFHSGLLPLQQALGLLDAFRHLHPQASEFTHTATSGSSSARIDRWLVCDSLVSAVSAATVSDFQPADHYGVTLSLSPAAAPPRGPGVWSMPPFIVSHPAFKALGSFFCKFRAAKL